MRSEGRRVTSVTVWIADDERRAVVEAIEGELIAKLREAQPGLEARVLPSP
ncbi:MAG: hypothetical protein H6712_34935 [Myxococcales bacterium]|nr:hypothetical protein [Myxococcales bacterium]